MSAIRGKDTMPELFLRRRLHSLGYRYKIHDNQLPGRPDLVFPSRKAVIFVHGCFWHRHTCKSGRSLPSVRQEFWLQKLDSNYRRDRVNNRNLRRSGWRVFTVWECELTESRIEELLSRVCNFLQGGI